MFRHYQHVSQFNIVCASCLCIIIVCAQYGSTPLIRAADWRRTEVAIELIKAKADINLKDQVSVR